MINFMNNKLYLNKYIKRSIFIHNSKVYKEVFDSIKERTKTIKTVYNIHFFLRNNWLSTLMVALFATKTFFSVKVNRSKDIWAISLFGNERKAIRHFEDWIGGDSVATVDTSLKQLVQLTNIKLFFKLVFNPKKPLQFLRIVNYLNKRYSFMPACCTANMLACYLRLSFEIKQKNPLAVVVSSLSNYNALALVCVAKSFNIPTIFLSHAHEAGRGAVGMPLEHSLAILQNPMSLEECKNLGEVTTKEIIYCGIGGKYKPLRVPSSYDNLKVSIFLSKPINIECLKNLIINLSELISQKNIRIRPHPVDLGNDDLKSALKNYSELTICKKTSLLEDAEFCDIAIVGASTVTLELLRLGKPCIYVSNIEDITYDYKRFVEKGILFDLGSISNIQDDLLEGLHNFYLNDEWRKKFKIFDPFYEQNYDVAHEIKQSVHRLIKSP
jgi:hypothetical protein